MASHFCLSVRFLDTVYHGQGDAGQREWPPSPLRLYQALVAAAARRNGGEPAPAARSALEWMQTLPPPVVVAPPYRDGNPYRLSVPNNSMDIVARAWARGNEFGSGDAHRAMKAVRPTLLDSEAVHYVWPMADAGAAEHIGALSEAARSIAALGWGMDLAVGHGTILSDGEIESLAGERWLPGGESSADGLRVPMPGTLPEILSRHERFLRRITNDGFVPPPPLARYRKIEYRPATQPAAPPFAAFQLLRPDADGFQPFDAARRGLTLAGMLRGAAKAAALRSGWPAGKIASLVLGHAADAASGPRFAYVPVPTIEARPDGAVAGSVRRVMTLGFGAGAEDVAWAARALSGEVLREEGSGRELALLSLIPRSDPVIRRYQQPTATWATVTPAVLPGFDDPRHYRRRLEKPTGAGEQRALLEQLEARIDRLLRKAIVQAGIPEPLAVNAGLEWRKAGFWRGVDPAERYGVPDHLKRFPRYHVKVVWRDAHGKALPIPGPICIGGGRFYGLGLMAGM